MQFDPLKIPSRRESENSREHAQQTRRVRVSRGAVVRIGLVSIRLVSMQHFRGESEARERAAAASGRIHRGSRNESYLRPHASIRLILDSARYTYTYASIDIHTGTQTYARTSEHTRYAYVRTHPAVSFSYAPLHVCVLNGVLMRT